REPTLSPSSHAATSATTWKGVSRNPSVDTRSVTPVVTIDTRPSVRADRTRAAASVYSATASGRGCVHAPPAALAIVATVTTATTADGGRRRARRVSDPAAPGTAAVAGCSRPGAATTVSDWGTSPI